MSTLPYLCSTIRSKSEEFIVICRYSPFPEFEFSRSAQFLHFDFKNCVKKKVKASLGLYDWLIQSCDTRATTYKRQSGNFQTHFMHVLQVTTLDHMFFRFKITCTYVRLPLYEVKQVFVEEHLVIKNCHIAIASQISLNHISIRITRSHNQKTYSIK